jgi:hypothetical protein
MNCDSHTAGMDLWLAVVMRGCAEEEIAIAFHCNLRRNCWLWMGTVHILQQLLTLSEKHFPHRIPLCGSQRRCTVCPDREGNLAGKAGWKVTCLKMFYIAMHREK